MSICIFLTDGVTYQNGQVHKHFVWDEAMLCDVARRKHIDAKEMSADVKRGVTGEVYKKHSDYFSRERKAHSLSCAVLNLYQE